MFNQSKQKWFLALGVFFGVSHVTPAIASKTKENSAFGFYSNEDFKRGHLFKILRQLASMDGRASDLDKEKIKDKVVSTINTQLVARNLILSRDVWTSDSKDSMLVLIRLIPQQGNDHNTSDTVNFLSLEVVTNQQKRDDYTTFVAARILSMSYLKYLKYFHPTPLKEMGWRVFNPIKGHPLHHEHHKEHHAKPAHHHPHWKKHHHRDW
jgi:hypothetical protein